MCWKSYQYEKDEKNVKNGVFWIIHDNIYAYPFDGSIVDGIAKSEKTYNYERLWNAVNPANSHKPFNYYPRGRVEISSKGQSVIYMSPHISKEWMPEICKAFEITNEPIVRYDHSHHYHCYMDGDTMQ